MTHPVVLAVIEGGYPLNDEGRCPNCGCPHFEVTFTETTVWTVDTEGSSAYEGDIEGNLEPTKVKCEECGLELVREGVCNVLKGQRGSD